MITVYLLSFNEEYLLPQVDKWWRDRFSNVKFVLYDNESTDNTKKLALERGWQVIDYHSDGLDDVQFLNIKNHCWKNCSTTWAWVGDMDEIPGFNEEQLKQIDPKYSVIKMRSWEIIDAVYTIQEANYGVLTGQPKTTLLQPSKLTGICYNFGCHTCNPIIKSGVYGEALLDLYHMKWFSPTHALNRAFICSKRMSKENIRTHRSFHFTLPVERLLQDYVKYYNKREKILSSKVIRSNVDSFYTQEFASLALLNKTWPELFYPVIMKEFNPSSIVDIGCGTADILKPFEDHGITIKGIDGSKACKENSKIQQNNFFLHDLRDRIAADKKYDLCFCLEVAEHIEEEYSNVLVDNLVTHSKTIIFTAAPPGQPGINHINCKPKEWWIKKFENRGFYTPDIETTERLKKELKNIPGVQGYYINNLILFRSKK